YGPLYIVAFLFDLVRIRLSEQAEGFDARFETDTATTVFPWNLPAARTNTTQRFTPIRRRLLRFAPLEVDELTARTLRVFEVTWASIPEGASAASKKLSPRREKIHSADVPRGRRQFHNSHHRNRSNAYDQSPNRTSSRRISQQRRCLR